MPNGSNGTNVVDLAQRAALGSQPPYAVAYARLQAVTALVVCRCRNVPVVVEGVGVAPTQCPVCRAGYYITRVVFDADAHYRDEANQHEGAPPPPVNITVTRVEPAIMGPGVLLT